ncbi:NINE protein [Undibacterium sp. TC4M20W]|uniref:NINE protein n=1 Tax=Undibacterium sp. TC4M20W TaxID=3413052 RepID=UPI003BF05203
MTPTNTSNDISNHITPHKNKTLATLLAALFGAIGLHRFYLGGKKDKWGWLHFITLPISMVIHYFYFGKPEIVQYSFLLVSFLIAILETLVMGLTPDEKWDARHNSKSGKTSESNWPLALLLVLTLAVGAFALIATIARTFDLLYTGGAYG